MNLEKPKCLVILNGESTIQCCADSRDENGLGAGLGPKKAGAG
jgi:hypothetical protein